VELELKWMLLLLFFGSSFVVKTFTSKARIKDLERRRNQHFGKDEERNSKKKTNKQKDTTS